MKCDFLIKQATIINEGKKWEGHVYLLNDKIHKIASSLVPELEPEKTIEAKGKWLFPGIIDGQVHFRDPGLTHKADLRTETRAAVAGGVTSFFEMPNTKPNTLSLELVEEKNTIAKQKALANYCFMLGVNAENVDEIIKLDTAKLPAITDDGLYFSGAGNILADSPEVMAKIFRGVDTILAIHSELEEVIEKNEAEYRAKYGEDVPVKYHPIIRSAEGCYQSTKRAIEVAKENDGRLHILHLSTAR